ncbi:glycosyltransferase [uncultured Clostridium sp.]|uniref:glycosyltransferase n=1 Tax=uncultured Clostridium sp. TaxID=59620 RepID=UPI0025D41455|nr:glycosyltransferase [uncultured Clostridium sp.]
MNILYLNNDMTIGGVSKCILKLTKGFKNNNNIFIASKSNGVLLPEFERMGIKNIDLVDIDDKSPKNVLKNIFIIKKAVEKYNIDIIHSHHRMTTLLAKIVSKLVKVKVIHTQHLCINDKYKLTKIALNNIKVITVSDAAKRILVEKSNLRSEDITTIYNAIETQSENKVIDEQLTNLKEKGYFVVSQISRIVDYKGVYDFIEIAKAVSEVNDHIKFVLIGDGCEYNNISEQIERENLGNIVYLLGPKDNVIEHLKKIDVVLLCSYIEGLPLAPIESFSQGVPVIATDIDGTNEEIIDGYNGYLVKKKDIGAFKKDIIKLYEDKDLYSNMKENCINIFKNKFNEKIYYKKHSNMYLMKK